jgi:hypothetical protein
MGNSKSRRWDYAILSSLMKRGMHCCQADDQQEVTHLQVPVTEHKVAATVNEVGHNPVRCPCLGDEIREMGSGADKNGNEVSGNDGGEVENRSGGEHWHHEH